MQVSQAVAKASIDLEPIANARTNSGQSNVSDLSKTFWEADISIKLTYESVHERIKHVIPSLDLTRLPLESDEGQ